MPVKSDRQRSPEDGPDERASRAERRRYKKPQLVEYGPVAKLTQMMTTGSITDGSGQMMTCL